jgi:hypothetical protein
MKRRTFPLLTHPPMRKKMMLKMMGHVPSLILGNVCYVHNPVGPGLIAVALIG